MEAYDEYLEEYAKNASELEYEGRERLAEDTEFEVTEFYEKISLFKEQLLEVLNIINDMRNEESNLDNTNN